MPGKRASAGNEERPRRRQRGLGRELISGPQRPPLHGVHLLHLINHKGTDPKRPLQGVSGADHAPVNCRSLIPDFGIYGGSI
jgi:hypothetical protein